jgi:hypothetical protein
MLLHVTRRSIVTAQSSNEIAVRYFECIRERNHAGIVALFADNASCVMPDGRSFAGQAAVADWFTKLFAAQTLSPNVLAIVAGHTSVAAEIENELADGTKRNTANFFHLDESGLIQHLRVYKRG